MEITKVMRPVTMKLGALNNWGQNIDITDFTLILTWGLKLFKPIQPNAYTHIFSISRGLVYQLGLSTAIFN